MNKEKNLPSIIFFGTPEFARFCLEFMIDEGFHIKAVVTTPDRRAGRGKNFRESSVKTFAKLKGILIFQPTNLKEPEFILELTKLYAQAFVVVAFRMLPEVVWSIPTLGTINLHASLLPNYRGAAPINWVLINGDTISGITTFLINEAIDSGSILMQKEVLIEETDDASSLHDKLLKLGAPLIANTLIGLKNETLVFKKQQLLGTEKIAPKLNLENTRIDWNCSLYEIENLVRGLSPYPGAWSFFLNKSGEPERIKIFKLETIYKTHSFPSKQILAEGKKLYITHKEGFINCIEIQLQNKKRMTSKSLLNGYQFSPNTSLL